MDLCLSDVVVCEERQKFVGDGEHSIASGLVTRLDEPSPEMNAQLGVQQLCNPMQFMNLRL